MSRGMHESAKALTCVHKKTCTGGLKLVLSGCIGVKATPTTQRIPPSPENQKALYESIWPEYQLVLCPLTPA